jgi:hypothetical protein
MPLTARRRLALSASVLPIASEAVAPSLAAQTRLQRPGRVVQPGVDDTRVVAALVASQFRLFLKDGQAEPGFASSRRYAVASPISPPPTTVTS